MAGRWLLIDGWLSVDVCSFGWLLFVFLVLPCCCFTSAFLLLGQSTLSFTNACLLMFRGCWCCFGCFVVVVRVVSVVIVLVVVVVDVLVVVDVVVFVVVVACWLLLVNCWLVVGRWLLVVCFGCGL